jgi:DNA-binding transcriptional ArsR family regulator
MRPLQENDVFHAIAHPARRRMLQALKAGERPAADLARPFGISFSAISQHLKILKDAHLVTERREGRNRLYQLRIEPLHEVHTWAEEFRALWSARLDALETHLNRKHPKK